MNRQATTVKSEKNVGKNIKKWGEMEKVGKYEQGKT